MRARYHSVLLLPYLSRTVLADLRTYRTEPTIHVPVLNITTFNDTARLFDGYIFLTPFIKGQGDSHVGPLIYEKSGNLIWSGIEHTGLDQRVDNLTPCDYLGSSGDHLCWHGNPLLEDGEFVQGGHRIFDNNYKEVCERLDLTGGVEYPDGHESNILKGGRSLMQVVYHLNNLDLSPYKGPEDGFAKTGCFQEIDIEKRAPVFDWCFLDHLPIWDTYLFPMVKGQVNNTVVGAGKGTKKSMWDPQHINGADKNEDGDYIVSFRHLYQIIKVAGNNNLNGREPGTMLWRFGGKSGNIKVKGTDVPFATQHMPRFVWSNSSGDAISLFNNNFRMEQDAPAHVSSGQVWFVNNSTMTAELLREYPAPHGEEAGAAGSMAVLPNGNAFINWGLDPHASEHAKDGTLLLDFTWSFGNDSWNMIYRTYSGSWKGYPTQPPKAIAYKRYCDSSPLILHVSWNGATEVDAWRVSTRAFDQQPWIRVGTFKKDGFETTIDLTSGNGLAQIIHQVVGFVPYISVQALDANGVVLDSTEVKTFVPIEDITEKSECDDYGCGEAFPYEQDFNIADLCQRSTAAPITALLIISGIFIAVIYCLQRAVRYGIQSRRSRSPYALVQNEEYSDEPIALHEVSKDDKIT